MLSDALFGSRVILVGHLSFTLCVLFVTLCFLKCLSLSLCCFYSSCLSSLFSIVCFFIKELGEVIIDNLRLGRVLSRELFSLLCSSLFLSASLSLCHILLSEGIHFLYSLGILENLSGLLIVCRGKLSFLLLSLFVALSILERLSLCLRICYRLSLCRLVCLVCFLVKELGEVIIDNLGIILGNDNTLLSRLFSRLLCLFTLNLFLICKKECISLLAFKKYLRLVRFVLILSLGVALIGMLCLSRRPLESLSLLERRLSRILLFCPVGIVTLSIVYVGVNDLLGGSLNRLGFLYCNRLVSVVECYESRRNVSLILLSALRSLIALGGEFLLSLRSLS